MSNNCEAINSKEVVELFKDVESTPEIREDLLDNCAKASVVSTCSSLYSTGILATMIDTYIKDPNNIASEAIRDMVIRDTPYVTTKGLWDGQKAGDSPRIIVEYMGSKTGHDLSFNQQTGYNIRNGSSAYISEWTLQHAIYCIANTYNTSLLLANEIKLFLHHNKKAIESICGFVRFRVMEEGRPDAITNNNSTGEYSVAIQTAAVAVENWFVFEMAPTLKRIKTIIDNN